MKSRKHAMMLGKRGKQMPKFLAVQIGDRKHMIVKRGMDNRWTKVGETTSGHWADMIAAALNKGEEKNDNT